MTSIRVKYRHSTVKGREGTIFYQIIFNRKVRQLNTQYRVFQNEWDESRSSVVTKKTGNRKLLLVDIREQIRRDLQRLNRIVNKFETDGQEHTAEDIVKEFKRCDKKYSLFNFMEDLIIKFKQDGKIRTSETYSAALNSFKRFRHGEDLMLDSLSPEIMESYESWHRLQGNAPNTISFYARILRAAYNRAVEAGNLENRHPFRRIYTGTEKTAKRALPLTIIKKIKRLDLSFSPSVDFARDMFLMSFYLRGMSFIDMAYLKKTDLKNGSVVYRRRKTGQQLTIGWTKEMQKLVDKYPENPTQYLLPIIRTVGCDERCAYKNVCDRINFNLKKIAGLVKVSMPLTMYVARHSWASAAKAKGFPVSVISEGMGHDSEVTTQIYLTSLDTTRIDRANSIIIKSL